MQSPKISLSCNMSILTYKDFQHGAFEIQTKEVVPRYFMVDDPGVTIELNRTSSGIEFQQLPNTPAQMANFLVASQNAAATHSVGQQDPFIRQQQRADIQQPTEFVAGPTTTRTASAGSGSGGLAVDPSSSVIVSGNAPPQSKATSDSSNVTTVLSTTASAPVSFPTTADIIPPTTPFVDFSHVLKLTAPVTALATIEDQPTTINGFLINDAHSGQLTVTLTASSTLTLSSTEGLTFQSGDGVADETMKFSGSIADINAALEGMTYTPSGKFFGAGHVDFTISDTVETINGTLVVDISGVPDDPTAHDDVLSPVNANSGLRINSHIDVARERRGRRQFATCADECGSYCNIGEQRYRRDGITQW